MKILDINGKPATKAKVEFMLYNYAEFYPIATKYTNNKGVCSSITGYGDLMVWASQTVNYGYQKVSGQSNDTIIIKLNQPINRAYAPTYKSIEG